MKRAFCLATVAFAVLASAADSLVTNLVVRQRSPWSNVVDIDYVYTGSCPTSMAYTATWDGQSTPVDLVTLTLTAPGINVRPGQVTFTWDPATSGYAKEDLKNFRLSIAPVPQDPRTYLVIDLKNGGYSTMTNAPAGGWTDEYKTTKLVLKRLYAGTYHWGTSETEYRTAFGNYGQPGAIGRGSTLHYVSYTSDYYFPIFELTREQYAWITSGTATRAANSTHAQRTDAGYYTDFRGARIDDGTTAVCWPQTGHKVSSTSFIGKLRAITAKTGQAELLADLPTTDQWQLPMCGGRNTFLPNGGTSTDSDMWKTYYDKLCYPGPSTNPSPWDNPVGLKDANDWGFYDFNVNWNPCLNWINANGTVDGTNPNYLDRGDRTDDVGPETPYSGCEWRVACGQLWRDYSTLVYQTSIFNRTKVGESWAIAYYVPRVVVNLKPLVTVD